MGELYKIAIPLYELERNFPVSNPVNPIYRSSGNPVLTKRRYLLPKASRDAGLWRPDFGRFDIQVNIPSFSPTKQIYSFFCHLIIIETIT